MKLEKAYEKKKKIVTKLKSYLKALFKETSFLKTYSPIKNQVSQKKATAFVQFPSNNLDTMVVKIPNSK